MITQGQADSIFDCGFGSFRDMDIALYASAGLILKQQRILAKSVDSDHRHK